MCYTPGKELSFCILGNHTGVTENVVLLIFKTVAEYQPACVTLTFIYMRLVVCRIGCKICVMRETICLMH